MVIPINFQTGNPTPSANTNPSTPVPVTASAQATAGQPAANAPTESAQQRSAQLKSIREDTLEYWYGGNNSEFDVVGKYLWTLSKRNRDDIPHAWLIEYNANETTIQKQLHYYTQLLPDKGAAAIGTAGLADSLDIYREIFPHTDRDNCCKYKFPYFNKTNMDLTTQAWQEITPAGEALAAEASKLGGQFGEGVVAGLDILNKTANIAAGLQYPIVGVLDRPKIFASHSERTITISFPLFNTVDPTHWKDNQRLITKLMSQNMLYKTSYVTGVPPVFYEILIPGQYYCWAACVTNLNIENLGNTRVIDSAIVPDAYQVTIALTEMVMPSKNQFDARYTGTGKVNVSFKGAINQGLQAGLEKINNFFNSQGQATNANQNGQ